MGNYITKVDRSDGRATRVEASVGAVTLAFQRGRDGKPVEVSRSKPAMVHTGMYVPKVAYNQVIKQVHGVFAQQTKKPIQLGFKFDKED